MEQRRDDGFLLERQAFGEVERVDPNEVAVGTLAHERLDRPGRRGIGRTAERIEEGVAVLHGYRIEHFAGRRTLRILLPLVCRRDGAGEGHELA